MKISLLQQMYKDILVGIPLAQESRHYTSLLDLCVEQPPERDESYNWMHLPSTNGGIRSHQDTDMSDVVVPTTDDISNSFANMNSFCRREVMLLQLTLLKMMVAKAESQETEFSMRQKYCEIIVLLLKGAKIDSKLVCLLGSRDQLLSHMASKCLASLVYFQLKEESTLNVTWLAFTLETLSGFPVNTQVADCLWTVAATINNVLKDEALLEAGRIAKLLAPLDAVLEGFYNSILLDHFDSRQYTSPYSEAANSLISFTDLLEALLASRNELELLRCQRVLFLKVSHVLNLVSSSIHYLIKKKFIMLLKKCALYKSREDAVSGSLFSQTPSLAEDMLALSNAVLQVVDLSWLNGIPLREKASYFGSSDPVPGDDSQGGSDQTVLRALSLVVLKAVEFKFRNSAAETEVKGNFEHSMSQLLMFWRSHLKPSLQSHPVVHQCEWLSLIFMEQDDDMWEAAKALLLIYLKFDRLWRDAGDKEEGTWNFLTHASGFNPHCIFLFFLEKIAFDSTVLLDFLISSETCFLEYLVRYLKLLKEDWHQFVEACNHFDTKHRTFCSVSSSVKIPHEQQQSCMTDESLQNACCEPEPQTLRSLAASHSCLVFTTEQGANEVAESNQSNSLIYSDSPSLLGSLQSLVNYDSSEDSELESDGKECLVNIKQVPSNNEDERGMRETSCNCRDDKQNTLKSAMLPLKQKESNTSSCLTCMASPDNTIPLRIMLHQSTKCLEELQEAISRLQRRNLFPYNPSALLKLLSHVEKIRKNVNPQ
ncbi:LINES protein, partial [Psilopogon haemacephalus]|nr:LINES protein [Psilopogon haemacephalus]